MRLSFSAITDRLRHVIDPAASNKAGCGEFFWNCECGWTIAAIVAGVVVSAVAAGYSAYSASEQQARQTKQAKRMAEHQADADAAAGEARRKQVLYDAKRKAAGIRTREAAAGVQIGQGSLLEDEMQFAADNEYAAQIAQLPYSPAEDAARYEGRVFGSIKSRTGLKTGYATGSTLATGYGDYVRTTGKLYPGQDAPTPSPNYNNQPGD